MSDGRGGARHTPKPMVDPDLLMREFKIHRDLLTDLGAYEKISKSQATNPKGLLALLPLLKGLLKLAPTCEIHGASLREGVFQCLLQDPELNDSKYNGRVWTSLKVDRLTVALFHLRTRASKPMGLKWSSSEEVVDSVEKKDDPLAERGEPSTLAERDGPSLAEKKAARSLKQETSDISLDSNGYPKCLASPADGLPTCGDTQPLLKGRATELHQKNSIPCTGEVLEWKTFQRDLKSQ